MRKWWKDNNIGLKMFAVLCAALLWSFVVVETDAVISSTYTVDVEVEGQNILKEKNLRRVDSATKVSVSVEGTFMQMSGYSADLISAKVKIPESIEEGERTLLVDVNTGLSGISLHSRPFIKIVTEKVITVPIKVDFVPSGKPENNYFVDEIMPDYEVVTITGIRSAVEKVKSIRAVYNLDGRRDSFKVGLVYELLDAAGNVIDITTLDSAEPTSLHLDVSMKMESSLALNVNLLAAEYLANDEVLVSVNPGNIVVYGTPDVIEALNAIELEEVSLKYVIENEKYVITRPIRVPDGATAVKGTPTEAVITIEIPGYERKLITFTEADLPEDSRYAYPAGQTFEVVLFGKKEDLALLTPESVSLTINGQISSAEPGEVVLPLNVNVNVNGVSLISKPSAVIQVLESSDPDFPPEVDPPVLPEGEAE